MNTLSVTDDTTGQTQHTWSGNRLPVVYRYIAIYVYIGCLVVTVVRVHRLRGNVTITSRGRFTHSEKCDVDSAFHVRLKQSRFLITPY